MPRGKRRVPARAPVEYLDLAEAVERGGVPGDGSLEYGDGELRERYTIELGTLDAMIAALLTLLAADAGSVRRALVRLSVPTKGLIHAWTRGVAAGMRASVAWLAAHQHLVRHGRVALTPSVRALRGDDYADLADVAGALGVAGDGALDPARLRRRYTIERAPWLRMVGDLLGQVVADAGSVEGASTVLGVPLDSLTTWVRWLVSRGSTDAARSRWPVAPVGDALDLAAYDDLAEAVERGAVDGDNSIDAPSVRDVYSVRLDSWDRMWAELLAQIVADAGSVRSAAKLLDVPRSTLGARLTRHRV